jgi:putative serine protease PepD
MNETQEQPVNRNPMLRRTAPIAAALALGAGAGAGVYAGVTSGGDGGSTARTTTVVASVPAQSTAAAAAPATALTQIYKNASDGVVDIRVRTSSADGFGGPQQGQAEGSGFVWDEQGHIVTNAHVVDGATAIQVRFEDGTVATATLVGKDEGTDIAVIDVNVPAAELDPLPLGTSTGLLPGATVVALGSPFGLPGTMTAGIISAVDRTITAPNDFSIAGAIQTDAAINHGNSGGPLLDSTGRVIGVNAQIESNSNDNAGIGFAIPIDAVKDVGNTIIAGKTPQHAYLGVQIGDADSGVGAVISRVVGGGPAAKAGLQAGDVVTAIAGKAITDADDLTARVSTFKPGDKTTVTYKRTGSTKTATVTFTQRPS